MFDAFLARSAAGDISTSVPHSGGSKLVAYLSRAERGETPAVLPFFAGIPPSEVKLPSRLVDLLDAMEVEALSTKSTKSGSKTVGRMGSKTVGRTGSKTIANDSSNVTATNAADVETEMELADPADLVLRAADAETSVAAVEEEDKQQQEVDAPAEVASELDEKTEAELADPADLVLRAADAETSVAAVEEEDKQQQEVDAPAEVASELDEKTEAELADPADLVLQATQIVLQASMDSSAERVDTTASNVSMPVVLSYIESLQAGVVPAEDDMWARRLETWRVVPETSYLASLSQSGPQAVADYMQKANLGPEGEIALLAGLYPQSLAELIGRGPAEDDANNEEDAESDRWEKSGATQALPAALADYLDSWKTGAQVAGQEKDASRLRSLSLSAGWRSLKENTKGVFRTVADGSKTVYRQGKDGTKGVFRTVADGSKTVYRQGKDGTKGVFRTVSDGSKTVYRQSTEGSKALIRHFFVNAPAEPSAAGPSPESAAVGTPLSSKELDDLLSTAEESGAPTGEDTPPAGENTEVEGLAGKLVNETAQVASAPSALSSHLDPSSSNASLQDDGPSSPAGVPTVLRPPPAGQTPEPNPASAAPVGTSPGDSGASMAPAALQAAVAPPARDFFMTREQREAAKRNQASKGAEGTQDSAAADKMAERNDARAVTLEVTSDPEQSLELTADAIEIEQKLQDVRDRLKLNGSVDDELVPLQEVEEELAAATPEDAEASAAEATQDEDSMRTVPARKRTSRTLDNLKKGTKTIMLEAENARRAAIAGLSVGVAGAGAWVSGVLGGKRNRDKL